MSVKIFPRFLVSLFTISVSTPVSLNLPAQASEAIEAKREELPVTRGSMESVDMHNDEPQQAEPEEDLDVSEFREEKPHNISQDDFPGTDVWMEYGRNCPG